MSWKVVIVGMAGLLASCGRTEGRYDGEGGQGRGGAQSLGGAAGSAGVVAGLGGAATGGSGGGTGVGAAGPAGGASGAETGGASGGGGGGASGAAGFAGVAGVGGQEQSGGLRYRACDWEWEQSDVTRIQIARWDDDACTCTLALFNKQDSCSSGLAKDGWCLTEASQTSDPAACDNVYVGSGDAASATGAIDGIVRGREGMTFDFQLTLPEGERVDFVSDSCRSDCSLNCEAPEGSSPVAAMPPGLGVVAFHVCDHYEVWVYSPSGYPIGALDYVLRIGTTIFTRYRTSGNYSLTYSIPEQDFAMLEDGATVSVSYGNGAEVVHGTLDKP